MSAAGGIQAGIRPTHTWIDANIHCHVDTSERVTRGQESCRIAVRVQSSSTLNCKRSLCRSQLLDRTRVKPRSQQYGRSLLCSRSALYGRPLPKTLLSSAIPNQADRRKGYGGNLGCRCAGGGPAWFEFSSGGSGDSAQGTNVMKNTGDFTILSHLQQLGCGEIKRRPREIHFSGCINESYAFHCTGGDFFVKINRTFDAASMFQGEMEGLQIMASTSTVRIPEPFAFGSLPEGGSYIIMEYLPFRPFGMIQAGSQEKLGGLLARMHTADLATSAFGFPSSTRLGVMPLTNDWSDSWKELFVTHRLKDRLKRVFSRMGADDVDVQELRRLEDRLIERALDLLDNIEVRPSVLHGDLWVGNSGLTRNGEVAIFDPACFYGHSEFDLAFRGWPAANGFPGFVDAFYDAYHEVIPPAPGFDDRHQLYQFFHLLNHLLIYGMEYYEHVMEKAKKLVSL